MPHDYLKGLRHGLRMAHCNAPPSFRDTLYKKARWRPLTTHLTTPPALEDTRVMCRAIPISSARTYGRFALDWQTVEICSSVRLSGERIVATFRREYSEETALFWTISHDGTDDCFVVLSGHYVNEVRPSERFSMDGYRAKPDKSIILKEASENELRALDDQHDWFERIERHFRNELEAIAAHHRHALQRVDAALGYMDKQIAA